MRSKSGLSVSSGISSTPRLQVVARAVCKKEEKKGGDGRRPCAGVSH